MVKFQQSRDFIYSAMIMTTTIHWYNLLELTEILLWMSLLPILIRGKHGVFCHKLMLVNGRRRFVLVINYEHIEWNF